MRKKIAIRLGYISSQIVSLAVLVWPGEEGEFYETMLDRTAPPESDSE